MMEADCSHFFSSLLLILSNLHTELVAAMRSGSLQTFFLKKRGKRVLHTTYSTPGWMKWAHEDGVTTCSILSPKKPGMEWKFFSAFLGRLADRFANKIQSVNVQFPGEPPRPPNPAKVRKVRR
jgi:hypothetical protein